MKKSRSIAALALTLSTGLCGCSLEFQEMDVLNTSRIATENCYSESISVIADWTTIANRGSCTNQIIQKVLNNNFKSVRFSFDEHGYPSSLSVTVYSSEKNYRKGKAAYCFDYVSETDSEVSDKRNNIKDHPEKFKIRYREN